MLVLSRKQGESIKFQIGTEWVVMKITRLSSHRVSIGIEANRKINIVRAEIEKRNRS